MAPRNKFSREEIISAAVRIVRREGSAAVTARSIAAELGASSKVIFGYFENMEMLQSEIINRAGEMYREYVAEDMASGKYPPYKTSGMAYIRFAMEEKELFRLLFMRDRQGDIEHDDSGELENVVEILQRIHGLAREDAMLFHLEMWAFVHGIAAMIATDYYKVDIGLASRMVTDAYQGLCARFCRKESE